MKKYQLTGTRSITKTIMFYVAFICSNAAIAAPVDLTPWTADGDGAITWTVQAGNTDVLVTGNANPAVFHNGLNSQGFRLSGTVEVQTMSDDDFMGFVLGYNNGDITNGAADYLLIDWKQGDQTAFGANALEGLAISQVNGALTNTDAWGHIGNVTELQRATNFGSTGWADNTSYQFEIVFTPSLVEFYINGVLELSISGAFNNGSFGFYSFSQPNALFSAIDQRAITPPAAIAVPLPAGILLFSTALLLLLGSRKLKSNPHLLKT